MTRRHVLYHPCSCTLLKLILAVFQLHCRQRPRVYSKYSDIATLLDPPHYPIRPPCSCWLAPSRNERLACIFRLGNSFVSAESRVRKQFIARARTYTNFAGFSDSARFTVAGVASHLLSPSHSHRNAIPFATFVQVVTMRLVVCSFLGGDIPQDTDEDVIFVVHAINELWASSKKSPIHTQAEVLEHLNGHLLQWLPTYERRLDFVISAYLDSPNECQYKHHKHLNNGGQAWNISYGRYYASIHRADGWRGQHPHNSPGFQHGVVLATRS